jgi:hypothetical protein
VRAFALTAVSSSRRRARPNFSRESLRVPRNSSSPSERKLCPLKVEG